MKIVSFLYSLGSFLNHLLYRIGIKKIKKFNAKIISVGNLSAGGEGKTTLVGKIGEIFPESLIVTRGYRGKEKGPVLAQVNANRFGDEASFLAEIFPNRVIVSKKKSDGITFGIEKLHGKIFILDDAFQNHTIEKDIEILAIDATRPFGNLRREFFQSAERATAIVLTRSNLVSERELLKIRKKLEKFSKKIFLSEIRIKSIKRIKDGKKVPFPQKPVAAFCGIGNPYSFKELLLKNGFSLEKFVVFPDHHKYTSADLEKIPGEILLTTSKDAVKIKDFCKENLYEVLVDFTIDDELKNILLQDKNTP